MCGEVVGEDCQWMRGGLQGASQDYTSAGWMALCLLTDLWGIQPAYYWNIIRLKLKSIHKFWIQNPFCAIFGVLDLIKTQIIWFRAPTYFENDQDKNSYNINSVSLGY